MQTVNRQAPGVTVALNIFGWASIVLSAVAAISMAVDANISMGSWSAPFSDYAMTGAGVIFGIVLLGLSAVVNELHNIEILLSEARTSPPA